MDFLIDISVFIHLATIGVSLLLAVVIAQREAYYKQVNRYLIYLLAAVVLVDLNASLILSGYQQAHYYVQNLSNASILIIGPSIYLVMLFRSGQTLGLKQQLVHFIPFFLYALIILAGFIGESTAGFMQTIEPVAFGLFLIQVPTYTWIALCRPNAEPLELFKGLRLLLKMLLVTYALQLVVVLTELLVQDVPNGITLNVSLFFSFAIIALAYRSFSNEKLLFERPKYAGSTLNEIRSTEIMTMLNKLMEEQKPFIRPDLKLADLAQQLGLSGKYISQAINASSGQSFNDYINAYRVRYVAALIEDPSNAHYTLLAIAEQGGFKSGSVFNAAFKKHQGVLPSQYRKTVLGDKRK